MKQAVSFSLFALLLAGRVLAGSGLNGCPPLKTTLSATDIDQVTFLVSLESNGDMISWELGGWTGPEVTNAHSRCDRSQVARIYVSAEGPTFVKEIELVVMSRASLIINTPANDVGPTEIATPLARITKLGTVDWLNGRDLAQTRLGDQMVDRVMIVDVDWAAMRKFAFDDADDLDFTLPLFDGNTCKVIGRKFSDLPSTSARRVVGYCKGYAEILSGVNMEKGKFGMMITPRREQFRLLVTELNDTQAGVFQIPLSPEDIALNGRID